MIISINKKWSDCYSSEKTKVSDYHLRIGFTVYWGREPQGEKLPQEWTLGVSADALIWEQDWGLQSSQSLCVNTGFWTYSANAGMSTGAPIIVNCYQLPPEIRSVAEESGVSGAGYLHGSPSEERPGRGPSLWKRKYQGWAHRKPRNAVIA